MVDTMLQHCKVWVNLCILTIEKNCVLKCALLCVKVRKLIAHQHGERGINGGE